MLKLLLIDDSRLILSRLSELLQDWAEIETASTLAQALQCARRSQPDLIVLDFHLPDGNAISIMDHLRQSAPGADIAILSNDASDFSRQRCLYAGADWFFDKSTEFEKLLELVRQRSGSCRTSSPAASEYHTPTP